MAETIKVLIADDQLELAEELKNVLETDERIQVVGLAADGFEALEQMSTLQADVVLMDIRMPNMNGVVATSRIKAEYPQVKVVILTTFDDSDYILNAINNGASGYLLKDISGTALIDAVKDAYNGDTIFRLSRAFAMSDREVEIALMMYEGFTNRQISSALKLSEGTTRNYVSAIYEKTGCENRAAAIDAIKAVL